MPPIITVFKIIAIFYILIRAENAVKFELQSLLKMEEKTKEEQGGRHNENGMECGKCKFRDKVL